MAFYDFLCTNCPKAPLTWRRVRPNVEFTKAFPMAKAPKLGAKIKCPCCGRKTAERVVSSGIAGIVRGHERFQVDTKGGYSANINGQELRFSFVDHKLGDPELQRDLSTMAKRQGIRETNGLSNARFDPKRGRMVVDVASNMPDPLGMIERNKKRGNFTETKKKINTPFKMRPRRKK